MRYAEDGLLVMTNHAVCPQHAGQEAYVPPDSRRSYRRLKELLGGEPNVDLEAVRKPCVTIPGWFVPTAILPQGASLARSGRW